MNSAVAPTIASTGIHDGFYTVVGYHAHYTFRLVTNDADAAFAPGKQIISYLTGPCNESDYVAFGFVINGRLIVWKRFAQGYERIQAAARFLLSGNPGEHGKAYALESGRCYICNRTLTTPESIAAGIGPTCAGKVA